MKSLANARHYNGLITAVHGPAEGPADLIRYDAVAVNTGDAVRLVSHLPARRISRGAEVIAALVDDPCIIVIRKDGEEILHAFTEGIPFDEACE